MKSFFQAMNFVRAVMLICFFAAAALGYMVYEGRGEVTELKDQVYRQAPALTRKIQELSVELSQLRNFESGNEFKAVDNPVQYIQGCAFRPDVSIGDVTATPKTAKSNVPGTVDTGWTITPADKKRAFSRARISNFLYILEAQSPFVVVTLVELRLIRKGKPEEHPEDAWTFKAEITTRVPAK